MAVTRTCGWRQSNPGFIPAPDMSVSIQEPSSQSARSRFQRWGRTVGGSEDSWVAVSAPKVTHWRGQSTGCFHNNRARPGRPLPRKSNPQRSCGLANTRFRVRQASASSLHEAVVIPSSIGGTRPSAESGRCSFPDPRKRSQKSIRHETIGASAAPMRCIWASVIIPPRTFRKRSSCAPETMYCQRYALSMVSRSRCT